MKTFLLFIFIIQSQLAMASYFQTECTNVDGDVKWKTGQIYNEMDITYLNDSYQTESNRVSTWSLDINFEKEYILNEIRTHECGFFSHTKTWASSVIIKANAENPEALNFLPENKRTIKTEVICRYHLNSRAPCP